MRSSRTVLRIGTQGTEKITISAIRPGDTLVVEASVGGVDQFGWNPEAKAARDVADLAAVLAPNRRFAVRLHPKLLKQEIESDGVPQDERFYLPSELWDEIVDRFRGSDWKASQGREAILDALLELSELPASLQTSLNLMREATSWDVEFPYALVDEQTFTDGFVIVARFPTRSKSRGISTRGISSTESDAVGLFSGEMTLVDHSAEVRATVESFGLTRIGIDSRLANDIALAGWLHDIGKADRRFQAFLRGTRWWLDSKVLAKSGRGPSTGDAAIRAAVGLPKGWRHEVTSVQLARAHPSLAHAYDPELVLWLIGTHHGHGRPFFIGHPDETCDCAMSGFEPFIDGATLMPAPGRTIASIDVEIDLRDDDDLPLTDWVGMGERLAHRYGSWGLAYFEATMRLADHRASERSGSEARPKAGVK